MHIINIYIYVYYIDYMYIYIYVSLGDGRLPEIDSILCGTASCCVASARVFFAHTQTCKILIFSASLRILALTSKSLFELF